MNKPPPLPNLFVPGFAKSGTSHLCAVLAESPYIYLPKEKEPHYFADDLVPDSYRTDLASYQKFYSLSKAPYRLDGSVSYLYSNRAIARIVASCESPRFLVMVRHPFDRMLSHYRFNKRNGVETRPFTDAIRNANGLKKQWLYDYREMSDYPTQIDRLLSEVDGSAQVRLIDYSEYRSDPKAIIQRISNFLSVEIPTSDTLYRAINVSREPKFPSLNALLRVDTGWKKAVKKRVPFRLRRSIKKYVHNHNITKNDIPVHLDSHAEHFKSELDHAYLEFTSNYAKLYL